MRINRFKGSLKPISDWIRKVEDNRHDIDSVTEIVDSKYVRIVFTFKKENKVKEINSEQCTDLLSR